MKVKHSKFNLSHENKLTASMGKLIPFMCVDVVPGDRFRCNSDMVLRMMPLIAPMMHRVDVYMHYFYVPTRLVWPDFETFLTGGKNGTTDVVHPYVTAGRLLDLPEKDAIYTPSSLCDYLGLPTTAGLDSDMKISALQFRAYDLIYNDWYRDENLIDPLTISLGNGEDTTTSLTIQKRAWRKDYFNNALPWAQRGQAAGIPIEGIADVTSDADGHSAALPIGYTQTGDAHSFDALSTGFQILTSPGSTTTQGAVQGTKVVGAASNSDSKLKKTNLIVNLAQAAAGITVNDLRWAVTIQKFLERSARSGCRMVEFLLGHFGVHSSDARLQRPEYLGGGKVPIVVGEVLQTSSTDETSPQGNMAGKGVAAGSLPGFRRYFEEFGYVFGILSIMPKSDYFQGIPRQFTRLSRYEQFYPEFCGLGEQAVLNKELFGESNNPDGVFGYVPRFQEYRSIPSTIHGEFRNTLKFWTLAREFSDTPVLGQDFIECNPSERVFAVEDESDKFIVDIYNSIQAVRPMPKHASPGVIL